MTVLTSVTLSNGPPAIADMAAQPQSDLADLVSQLDAPKFSRLARYMANLPIARDGLGLPATAYGLEETELLVRKFGQAASHGAWAATWVYHQAYLPVGLWDETSIVAHLKERITTGKRDLDAHPDSHAILYGEAQQRGDGQYIPTGTAACYYMSTNIAAPMSDAAMDEVGYHFRDAFGAHIEQFGFATPQSMSGTSPLEVRRFAVDLLNSPSSYYFLAREGRVSVVPVTDHGTYATGSGGKPAFATATSSLSLDVPGLSDLESLVGSGATSEADLQAFLTERPHFLLGLDDAYCEVSSHVALSSPSGTKLIPDFMIRCEDPARFAFVELKKPSASIQTRGCEPGTVARSAAQAIKQLMEYADAVSTSTARAQLRQSIGNAPFDPNLTVVIGRGSPDQRHIWSGLRAGLPNVQLVTYDFLLERARQSSLLNRRILANDKGS